MRRDLRAVAKGKVDALRAAEARPAEPSAPILPDSQRVYSLHDAFRLLLGKVGAIEHRDTDEAVHAARKTLKQARAALRLMRAAIGDAAYHSANKQLRDAARPLTPVRDTVAVLGALERMRKARDGKRLNSYASRIHRRLQDEHRTSREQLKQRDRRGIVDKLREVEPRISSLETKQPDTLSARHGITKSYQSGRSAFSKVRRRPSTLRLHEWRKQAKYLADELDLARQLLWLRLKKVRRRATRLAVVLGDDHDLALLRAKLREPDGAGTISENSAERKRLERRIQRKRRKLQSKAHRLGEQLYGERAAKFDRALTKLLR